MTCKNGDMANFPASPVPEQSARKRVFGRASILLLLSLVGVLGACLIWSWMTRGAMAHLPSLAGRASAKGAEDSQKTIVDLRPWQTAEALAGLAVTAEEKEHAREAERLADHEVDQAFAFALRQAGLRVQQVNLTGPALALSQEVDQLDALVKEDQAAVDRLTPKSTAGAGTSKDTAPAAAGDDNLEIAKAQLGLDEDQLADVKLELDRVSGDDRVQIQSELAAHEALMTKYDSEAHGTAQAAVVSVKQHGTLASRIGAWNSQIERYNLIQQAREQAEADTAALTVDQKQIAATVASSTAASAGVSRLASIQAKGAERQLLTISNDRIQSEQQLAAEYGKWSTQVLLQRQILLHLILGSVELIAFILIGIVLCDGLVRRVMANPALDRRQMQTLRSVLQLGVQVVGGLLILLVVFGWPKQMGTVLGLSTAGLTIALQDFILAFLGWFVLIGKRGIRVGDWVEINGVGGEVTDIGLMSTTLLETGTLAEKGHPTGRRITFLNNFAIRGQYFNFSTLGQWMWDEIAVTIPSSEDTHAMVERIRKAVEQETAANARVAEHEWKRGSRDDGLSRFSAAPTVNLRPAGAGVEVHVRYVTRASERFGVRNRLYQRVIDLLDAANKLLEKKEAGVVSGG